MEKAEFLDVLIKKGFQAIDEKGIPMVIVIGSEKKLQETQNEVKNIVAECNYRSSYGIKCNMYGEECRTENKKEQIQSEKETYEYEMDNDVAFENTKEDYKQLTLF